MSDVSKPPMRSRVTVPLQRLRAWFARRPDIGVSCVHGSDQGTCLDCSCQRGVAKEWAYNRHVYAHDTAETLPAELAWVEKLHDAYLGDEDVS